MDREELRRQRIEKRIKQKTLAAYAGIWSCDLSAYELRGKRVKEEARAKLEEGLTVIPLLRLEEILAIEARSKD